MSPHKSIQLISISLLEVYIEKDSDAMCGLKGKECHDRLEMSAVSTLLEECTTGLPYQARFFSHLRRC